MVKHWFITGTSSGLGRSWAAAALERGDLVAATARNRSHLQEFVDRFGDRVLPIVFDITDRPAVFAGLAKAHEHFGHLDVVVNNAAFGQYGMVEELSEQEARAQLETNFFGSLWVVQAALPLLRRQHRGHILQITSVGGLLSMPGLGVYNASKWALEGLSGSLAQEVAEFGIKVTIVEPGAFRTRAEDSARETEVNADYRRHRDRLKEGRRQIPDFWADPDSTSEAILTIVDTERPPLRLLLGAGTFDSVAAEYATRLEIWRNWQSLAAAPEGSPVGGA